MQEHSVTVQGETMHLKEPFFVLATQNPIEQEGTYPLPEAQLDRFMFKIMVPFSSKDDLITILDRTTEGEQAPAEKVMGGAEILRWRDFIRSVVVAPHVKDYACRVVLATHPTSEYATDAVKQYVRYGASPRGAQVLSLCAKVRALLGERYNVAFDDVADVALHALRHRIILNFEGEAEGVTQDSLIDDVLARLPRSVEEPAPTAEA
jgi:MoxR-like ATPase